MNSEQIDAAKNRRTTMTTKLATTAGLALVLLVGACATAQERQAREVEARTYEVSLQRHVQGYVYQMGCEALLPLARERLWDEGYEEVNYLGSGTGTGLETDWVDIDDVRRSRYEVHAHQVGHNRCAVQFLHQEEVGDSIHERRSAGQEMALLEHVNADEAQRVRGEARQEAREAYHEALREFEHRR